MNDILLDLACFLITILLFCYGMIIAPDRMTCPPHWHNDGVRRNGRFSCIPEPVGDPDWDGTWQRSPDRSIQPPGEIRSRIYCTGGARPISVDGRTVGCQRGVYDQTY